MLVSISINICWHFLVNWLPTYFGEDLKLAAFVGPIRDLLESLHIKADPKYIASGLLVALTFLAADVGNLGGGALSRYFAGRGMTPLKSRVVVMAACTVLISGGAWVGVAGNDTLVLVLIGLMAMGTAAFMANYFSFTQEVSPRYTGLVVGILGGLGNLFVARVLALAGEVKDVYGSFTPIFVLVGLSPFVGLAALVLGWGSPPRGRNRARRSRRRCGKIRGDPVAEAFARPLASRQVWPRLVPSPQDGVAMKRRILELSSGPGLRHARRSPAASGSATVSAPIRTPRRTRRTSRPSTRRSSPSPPRGSSSRPDSRGR